MELKNERKLLEFAKERGASNSEDNQVSEHVKQVSKHAWIS